MPNMAFKKSVGVFRKILQKAFKAESIDVRVFYYPLSEHPIFECSKPNSTATSISQRAINLPSCHDIINEELNRVVKVLERCILK